MGRITKSFLFPTSVRNHKDKVTVNWNKYPTKPFYWINTINVIRYIIKFLVDHKLCNNAIYKNDISGHIMFFVWFVGIIVGGFIVCWLPFFTMYVIRAFCPTCIPSLLFSVLFWLGYCNSALNPCIYALFSRDFRFAFKRILCRCICQCEKKPPPQVVPIFLSSLGDESDGNNEPGSDSR